MREQLPSLADYQSNANSDQPQRLEQSFTNNFAAMAIDRTQEGQRLPPIHEFLHGIQDSRRSSTASVSGSDSSTGSVRRSEQPSAHFPQQFPHYHPYLTPATSPHLAPDDSSMHSGRSRATRGVPITSFSLSEESVRESTPKAPSRKRRNPKAAREAGARRHQSTCFADLQNLLLEHNPAMHTLATVRAKANGWRDLKSNNISKMIANPLLHNKTDVLGSGTLVLRQALDILEAEIEFLYAIGRDDAARALAQSVANLGCVGFQMPNMRLRARL